MGTLGLYWGGPGVVLGSCSAVSGQSWIVPGFRCTQHLIRISVKKRCPGETGPGGVSKFLRVQRPSPGPGTVKQLFRIKSRSRGKPRAHHPFQFGQVPSCQTRGLRKSAPCALLSLQAPPLVRPTRPFHVISTYCAVLLIRTAFSFNVPLGSLTLPRVALCTSPCGRHGGRPQALRVMFRASGLRMRIQLLPFEVW